MSERVPQPVIVQEMDLPFEGGGPDAVRWRTLLSADRTRSEALTVGIAEVPPMGGPLPPHQHAQPEVYYVVAGTGVVHIDGEEHPIRPGTAVFIPGDARHVAWSTGEETLRILYVFPADSFSEIVYRRPEPA